MDVESILRMGFNLLKVKVCLPLRLNKILSMIKLCRLWFILPLIFTINSFAQEEFMVYGKVQSNIDSLHIFLYNKDNHKLIEQKTVAANKQYRLYLKYQQNYIIEYQAKDFNSAEVLFSSVLPANIPECCFVPMEINFRLTKTRNHYSDSIFTTPLIDIRFSKKLRNYNYDFDIDFLIEQRIMQAEMQKRQEMLARQKMAKIEDSLSVEGDYDALIHCGNRSYFLKEYAKARDCYQKAIKMKPERMYPHYKLEDIEYEENFGTKRKAIDIDTITPPAPPVVEKKPAPKPKPVYKRMTDEEIEKKLMKDIAQLVIEKAEDTTEAIERLSFLNDILDTSAIPVPDKKATASKPVAKPAPVKAKPEPKPEPEPQIEEKTELAEEAHKAKKDSIRKIKQLELIETFSEKDRLRKVAENRQRELKKKYPKNKTIVLEEDEYKTITKVYIRNNNKIDTYMKVEHKWGATFYFIVNEPYPNENITRAYFETVTKMR